MDDVVSDEQKTLLGDGSNKDIIARELALPVAATNTSSFHTSNTCVQLSTVAQAA